MRHTTGSPLRSLWIFLAAVVLLSATGAIAAAQAVGYDGAHPRSHTDDYTGSRAACGVHALGDRLARLRAARP